MSAKQSGIRQNATGTDILKKQIVASRERSLSQTESGQGIPSLGTLNSISTRISRSARDARNIMASLPDIELIMQLWVSSILSPNDLTSIDLTWSSEGHDLDPDLTGKMIKILQKYFEDTYKIKAALPEILENALFMTGSYPIGVIPESGVDEVINGEIIVSNESLKNKYYLGVEGIAPNKEIAFSGGTELADGIHITDNPDVVKKFLYQQRGKAASLENHLDLYRAKSRVKGKGLESLVSYDKIRRRRAQNHMMATVKPTDLRVIGTAGNPLVVNWPSESVIPLYVPSQPKEHVGYFILHDINGNPVSTTKDSDYYDQLIAGSVNGSSKSAMVSNILKEVGGQFADRHSSNTLTKMELLGAYSTYINSKLKTKLNEGDFKDLEFDLPEEIYRTMLGRALSNHSTQILFLPSELMTYIAFDYNDDGTGRSLLEKNKILASVRTALMFGNMMAALKNSTNKRSINITLDEDELDPYATVMKYLDNYSKVQMNQGPLPHTNPRDLISAINLMNTQVNVKGGSGFPDSDMEINDAAGNRTLIDTDLEDAISKRFIASFGISPEIVDNTLGVNFAAQVLNENALFKKRVTMKQTSLSEFLVDFVVKYTNNSGFLLAKLLKAVVNHEEATPSSEDENVIEETKEESVYSVQLGKDNEDSLQYTEEDIEILTTFLGALEIKLPAPESDKIDGQLELFDKYRNLLDTVIDSAYVSEEMLEMMFEDSDDRPDSRQAVAIIKRYYLRKFAQQHGILNELSYLLGGEDDDLTVAETMIKHNSSHMVKLRELLESTMKDMKHYPEEPEEVEDTLTEEVSEGEPAPEPVEEPTPTDEPEVAEPQPEEPAQSESPEEKKEEETPDETNLELPDLDNLGDLDGLNN